MRYWFDTEFMEDGKTIELLSIGIVAEDGREYYAIDEDADWLHANEWVDTNVLPQLEAATQARFYRHHGEIAEEVEAFVGEKPEFWAYYADYDWVVLCQLYGRMIDLPKGWPMFCLDVKQHCWMMGDPKLPEQTGTEHHALEDARWTKAAWDFLMDMTMGKM